MAMIGIVPEVFKEENYEFWKLCLKSYLVGQGLWDVVSREASSEEEETSQEWQRKNAQALHAIQLACGSQAYSKFKKNTHVLAKFAWEHLAEMSPTTSQHHEIIREQDVSDLTGIKEHLQYENLYNAIENDDIERVNEILKNNVNATTASISSHRDTPLHIAILSGKMKFALELVTKMPPEGLEISNEFGATPLSLAAITGKLSLAKAMVEKNPKLVTIKTGNTDQNSLPVIVASMYGRKKMVHYLYLKTPQDLFNPDNGPDGVSLLNNLITAEFYDIASMLLNVFPKLGVMADHHGDYALHKLAHKPSAFASGSIFPFWKQWIYKCVRIHSPWDHGDTKSTRNTNDSQHEINIPVHEEEFTSHPNKLPNTNDSQHEIDIPGHEEEEFISHPNLLHKIGWILLRFIVPDIKNLHDRKLVNDEAKNLLKSMFNEIKFMSQPKLDRMEIDKAVHNAIKHGIVEFVEELLNYNPEFIWRKDKRGRTIFSHAIILRQEKIFSLFYSLGTKKSIVASRHDIFQNNFLHLAAKLSPPAQLERVSGAARYGRDHLPSIIEVAATVILTGEEKNWKTERYTTVVCGSIETEGRLSEDRLLCLGIQRNGII